jgi:hypothetical protein
MQVLFFFRGLRIKGERGEGFVVVCGFFGGGGGVGRGREKGAGEAG